MLHKTHGRSVRLPAPVVADERGGSSFTEHVRQLEQWRQRYGWLRQDAGIVG